MLNASAARIGGGSDPRQPGQLGGGGSGSSGSGSGGGNSSDGVKTQTLSISEEYKGEIEKFSSIFGNSTSGYKITGWDYVNKGIKNRPLYTKYAISSLHKRIIFRLYYRHEPPGGRCFMKKKFVFLSVLFPLIAVFCLSGCGSPYPNEDGLFHATVLEYFDIPWLTKPENVVNENEYFYHNYYAYEATIPLEDDYLAYCQSLIDRFRLDAYNTGYFADNFDEGDFWFGRTVYVISPSADINDYFSTLSNDQVKICSIYFTRSLLQPYDEVYRGYPISELHRISIRYYHEPSAGFNLQITLVPGDSDLHCYRP